MNSSQQRRLLVICAGLIIGIVVVILRLISFQFFSADQVAELSRIIQNHNVTDHPDRGLILDRNMAVIVGNGSDYQVGVSPVFVSNSEEISTELAPILRKPRHELLGNLNSGDSFVVLAGRVGPDVAEEIRSLGYDQVQLDSLPRRMYPQDDLLCHVLGYVDFQNEGGSGLEGYYESELEGDAASIWMNISPLTEQTGVIAREGADLVLTIDRTVQYVVEEQLRTVIEESGAESGTIIVMDPRTGAILAMANLPCYQPYEYFDAEDGLLLNPAISKQYEPGSVMKLITMAAALDSGTVTPQTTYNDTGVVFVGGNPMYNWDRGAYGVTDMTGLLSHSLNVGAATIATWMGPDTLYNYFQRFGYSRPLGIDLMAEVGGQLPLPGDSNWTETNIGTNAFGQGLAVTPLQMLSAASALANDGYLMQPYLVQEIHKDGQVYSREPTIISRPVSKQTAYQLTAMAVNAVRTEVFGAQLEGYTVAGKTGTAQIPEGGIYHPSDTIASFIGWLPADDPELIVLVKIDRPETSPWGSVVAAPVFAELAKELVILLDIPPDEVRLQRDILAARSQGG
ncbi:MAG: penicillin-binding protein 2 [Candidatus Promineifilaceae bacterium]